MNELILERVEKYHFLVSISRFYKRRFTDGLQTCFRFQHFSYLL